MKIDVFLDRREFVRFGLFNALRLNRAWRAPAIFAAILCACACVCFLRPGVRGAAALGTVLLAVGLGLPAVYFLNFYLSLRRQAAKEHLTGRRRVYTLQLSPDAIAVDNDREHAAYSWEQVFHAYRNGSATYLYLSPQQAFLIPHAFVKEGAGKLWEMIEDKVPEDRRTILR